jgi:cytidylate kinase
VSAPGSFRGQVTLDGPSGTGKSSVARDVARRLGAAYLDTGAMYRAATVAVLDAGVSLDDKVAVARAVTEARIDVGTNARREVVKVDGVDVEGRDIGTVVLPEATLKIYLTASPEVRAQRRAGQLGVTDAEKIAALAQDMRRRDEYDSRRADSPLRPAEDAVVVDSTELSRDQVVARIVDLARSAVATGERA